MRVALAPMAGVTDSAFRLMNKLGGADLVYSEMAHVNAISFSGKKTLGMLKVSPLEFPYVVQLFGKDPRYFAKAAKIISTQGVPAMRYEKFSKEQLKFIATLYKLNGAQDIITKKIYSRFLNFQKQLSKNDLPITDCLKPAGLDINLGCPAKKVFGHGGGAALWQDLKNLRAALEAVLGNTDLPVSVKVRTAVGDVTLLDLLDHLKDLPLKRIMVHGRTYTQGFAGPIDTALIKKVIKKYPQFEFWVNGGMVDYKSARKIIKATGCNNLGIARGACGNPLLAEEIKEQNPTVSLTQEIIEENNKVKACILAYIHAILNYQSKGSHGIVEMRKHLAWYFKDFPGAKTWRKKLVTVKNIKEIENILSAIAKQV